MQISDLITSATTNPKLAVAEIKAEVLSSLRTGQVLSAKVETATQNNQSTLRIGQNQVVVETKVPLHAGQSITLHVAKTGTRPEFQLVKPPQVEQLKADLIRQNLPKQESIARLADKLTSAPPPNTDTRSNQTAAIKLPVVPVAVQRSLVRVVANQTAATTTINAPAPPAKSPSDPPVRASGSENTSPPAPTIKASPGTGTPTLVQIKPFFALLTSGAMTRPEGIKPLLPQANVNSASQSTATAAAAANHNRTPAPPPLLTLQNIAKPAVPLPSPLVRVKLIAVPQPSPEFHLQRLAEALQTINRPFVNQAAVQRAGIPLLTSSPPAAPPSSESARQSAPPPPLTTNISPPLQTVSGSELQSIKTAVQNDLLNEVRNLINQLTVNEKNVTPERIRQILDLSGLFLETKLALGTPPAVDLKSSLLRLLFSIKAPTPHHPTNQANQPSTQQQSSAQMGPGVARPMTGEFVSQLEGALARVNMNQLASVPNDAENRQIWQYEIPLQHHQNTSGIMVRLERDARADVPPEQKIWKVDLFFDFDPIGPLQVKLGLMGDEISSHFVAEQASTGKMIERALPKLDAAFIRAGLQVKNLSVRRGAVEAPSPAPNAPQRLVDEKA